MPERADTKPGRRRRRRSHRRARLLLLLLGWLSLVSGAAIAVGLGFFRGNPRALPAGGAYVALGCLMLLARWIMELRKARREKSRSRREAAVFRNGAVYIWVLLVAATAGILVVRIQTWTAMRARRAVEELDRARLVTCASDAAWRAVTGAFGGPERTGETQYRDPAGVSVRVAVGPEPRAPEIADRLQLAVPPGAEMFAVEAVARSERREAKVWCLCARVRNARPAVLCWVRR